MKPISEAAASNDERSECAEDVREPRHQIRAIEQKPRLIDVTIKDNQQSEHSPNSPLNHQVKKADLPLLLPTSDSDKRYEVKHHLDGKLFQSNKAKADGAQDDTKDVTPLMQEES